VYKTEYESERNCVQTSAIRRVCSKYVHAFHISYPDRTFEGTSPCPAYLLHRQTKPRCYSHPDKSTAAQPHSLLAPKKRPLRKRKGRITRHLATTVWYNRSKRRPCLSFKIKGCMHLSYDTDRCVCAHSATNEPRKKIGLCERKPVLEMADRCKLRCEIATHIAVSGFRVCMVDSARLFVRFRRVLEIRPWCTALVGRTKSCGRTRQNLAGLADSKGGTGPGSLVVGSSQLGEVAVQ
jgi:hypothetical protein